MPSIAWKVFYKTLAEKQRKAMIGIRKENLQTS